MSTTSNPSQYQLRLELEAMVLGDLLGPAGGNDEELTERSVRDRYLVGVLAPSRSGAPRMANGSHSVSNRHSPLITHHFLMRRRRRDSTDPRSIG